jgi:effector-binding domain-containing protein
VGVDPIVFSRRGSAVVRGDECAPFGASVLVMSTNEPEIVRLEPAITAIIRDVVAIDELPAFFDRSFSTLAEVISAQGTTITGPAFSLYHDHPSDTTDVEVGYPTDREIEPSRGAGPGVLPGGRVARVVHEGAYDELPAAWDELGTWMSERGLGFGMPFWEVYVTEPSPDMDPARLRTELNHPVED